MSIPDSFRTLIISEPKDGTQVTAKLAKIPRESLPAQGEVLIKVFYSSLNYKDALAVTGRGKIVRSFLCLGFSANFTNCRVHSRFSP